MSAAKIFNGFIFVCLILLFALPALAQVDTAWVRRYNGTASWGYEHTTSIAIDAYGNVYITGYGALYSYYVDYVTIKYDASGDQLWVQRYDGPGQSYDGANAIAVDGSGNVYVTGYSYGVDGNADYATVKYDPNGNELWVQRYNGPGQDYDEAYALAVDGSGNVYVTGRSRDTEGCFNYATVKYDADGNQLRVQRYAGILPCDNYGYAIAVDSSNNVYVTGASQGSDTLQNEDYATVKYDQDGNQLWVQRYNGQGNSSDWAKAIIIDGSGNIYVTGFTYGGGTNYDYTTIKYSPSGNQLWMRTYNGPGNYMDWAYAMATDIFGNVYVTGFSYGNGTDYDYATVKYDPIGNQLWVNRYNGPGDSIDYANAIATDVLGNIYVTGLSYGNGTNWDYATVKYNSSGDQLWVQRYSGPGDSIDYANAIAVDAFNSVCVTGGSCGSGTGSDYLTIKYLQRAEWTVLVYVNGDNDLEEFAIQDINEMEMVGSTDSVNVVVQCDRIPGFDNSNGDWTDTRRYYIRKDTDPNIINSIRLDSQSPLGELNMGDPQTLVDFVNWGTDHFPAKHYAIVVWNHGNGWYKKSLSGEFSQNRLLFPSVSDDQTDGSTIEVSNGEWESAISQIKAHLGRNIDLVGFDACLMQMWEVMDITDDYADYMVGSEELTSGDGWQYTQFLTSLISNPKMSAAELGQKIVDAAVDGSGQETESCVCLAYIPALTESMDFFAAELLSASQSSKYGVRISNVRSELANQGHEFWRDQEPNKHIDLYDFASLISADTLLPYNLRNTANDVMAAVDTAIYYSRVSSSYDWAHGIAIYYPLDAADYDERYDSLPVATNTQWDDFIKKELIVRGDVTGDGIIDIGDIVYLINYVFYYGSSPSPEILGDVNCDAVVDIGDIVYVINYVFYGGAEPSCQ